MWLAECRCLCVLELARKRRRGCEEEADDDDDGCSKLHKKEEGGRERTASDILNYRNETL